MGSLCRAMGMKRCYCFTLRLSSIPGVTEYAALSSPWLQCSTRVQNTPATYLSNLYELARSRHHSSIHPFPGSPIHVLIMGQHSYHRLYFQGFRCVHFTHPLIEEQGNSEAEKQTVIHTLAISRGYDPMNSGR